MQKILSILLLFISSVCFSQKRANIVTLDASNYKTKGICNGVRLDTLDSRFITVVIKVNDDEKLNTTTYKIDYGQGATNELYNDLKDENNKYIQFSSLSVLLNFMSYNGWLYQNTIVNQKVATDYAKNVESSEVDKLIFYKDNK